MSDGIASLSALGEAAAAGEVFLTPETAQKCSNACAAFVAGLQDLVSTVTREFRVGGFGTLPSGLALGEKFSALGSQDLPRVLAQHIEVATRLKSVFEAAGRAYEQTESHTTATILASGD